MKIIGEVMKMRLGIDDTKYILEIFELLLEKEKYGSFSPQSIEIMNKRIEELKRVIQNGK